MKRIELEEQEIVGGKGIRRALHYYDAQDNQIAHHKYYTQTFNQMETVSCTIQEGHVLIGVAVTTDKQGYVTWVNFLTWPENIQVS